MHASSRLPPGSPRLLALTLFLLAPIGAEYLAGYDNTAGQPVELLLGLLIFAPLYGAPALIIRELSRRAGLGWPAILALAASFGVIQAGEIDQSLFSQTYRDIPYWNDMIRPTFLTPLGISAFTSLCFIVGHIVWSFSAPIAIVEGFSPASASIPWLRIPGLVLVTLLYAGSAALVHVDHLQTESDHASRAQVVSALVVAALLAAGAFATRRLPSSKLNTRAPGATVVGVLGFIASLAFDFIPTTWVGVTAGLAIVLSMAVAVSLWARCLGWTPQHVVALASSAFLARCITAFLITPLGNVTPIAKYGHNVAFLTGVIVISVCAWIRSRPQVLPKPESPEQPLGSPAPVE